MSNPVPASDKGNVLRRTGRHTAIYAVGILFGKMSSVLLLPIYTRYLSPADYGILQLIDLTLDVIAIVAGSRLAAGVFHLYHKCTNEREQRELLSSAFLVLMLAFGAAGVGSWIVAPTVARLVLGDAGQTVLVRIASMGLAVQSLLIIPLAAVQLREQSRLFVGIGLTKLVVQVTLNLVLLVGFDLGPRAILISTVVSNLVVGIPLTMSLLKGVGVRWNRNAVRDMLRMGLPFIGVQLAKFVQTFSDRYFLRYASGMASVGLYGMGYQFGFLLAQVGFAPFITAWEPMRFEIARRPDRDAIFNRVFLYMNVALLSAAVVLTLFVGDFLRIATTPQFHPAARIVPLILVAYVGQSWSGFHNFGLFFGERTDLITVANWAGALLALVLYIVLIPPFGSMGAAWATAATFVASEWLTYRFAQRVHRVKYEWASVVRLCVLVAGVCGISLALPALPLAPSIASHFVLLSIYALLLWFGGVLSDDDRARLRKTRFSPRALIVTLAGKQ